MMVWGGMVLRFHPLETVPEGWFPWSPWFEEDEDEDEDDEDDEVDQGHQDDDGVGRGIGR